MSAGGPDDERDEAWLLARARGESVEPLEPQRVASYERLEQALRALPAPQAGEGWQAKVLAALDLPAGAEASGKPGVTGAASAGVGRPTPETDEAAAPDGAAARVVGGARAGGDGALRPSSAAGGDGGRLASSAGGARPRARWPVFVPLIAAALAAAALLIFLGAPPEPDAAAVAFHFERGQTRAVHGGDEAGVGDTLVLEARPAGAGELRVYRDRRELVLRCPGAKACELASDKGRPVWRAKAQLTAPGRYRAMVLSGAGLPAPAGTEDEDLGAAAKAGAKVESGSFTVR